MQKKYSWYSLLKAGLANQDWDKAIPSSKPKSKYDVILLAVADMVLLQLTIWLKSAVLLM